MAIPVRVEADGIGSDDEETDAAVPFCCPEALQKRGQVGRGRWASTPDDILDHA